MSPSLEDKIELIRSAPTQEEAFARYNRLMESYGYDRNVYSLINDHPSLGLKAQHGFVGTYPRDWMAYYYEKSYHEVDPVFYGALNSSVPFYWSDALERYNRDERLSEEHKRRGNQVINQGADAGVGDGLCISFISPLGEVAGVGLARQTPQKTRNYAELAEIYLLSAFFHDKFRGFLERPQPPAVTPREREILLWAAEGKADGDIGEILGISAPTVRFHWKNIFEKLEANSRWLAIIKAIRLQIITPHLVRAPYRT